MPESIKKDIIKWVQCEKKIIEYNKKIKELQPSISKIKEIQNELSNNILLYMENNNMTGTDIKAGDIKLKYKLSINQSSITRAFVEKRLYTFFKDEKLAKDATEYIYNDRPTITKKILKKYLIK